MHFSSLSNISHLKTLEIGKQFWISKGLPKHLYFNGKNANLYHTSEDVGFERCAEMVNTLLHQSTLRID